MTTDNPLTSRPHELLARAVETHAAIRDGIPHEPLDVLAEARSSQAPSSAPTRTRRAPRKRKETE